MTRVPQVSFSADKILMKLVSAGPLAGHRCVLVSQESVGATGGGGRG